MSRSLKLIVVTVSIFSLALAYPSSPVSAATLNTVGTVDVAGSSFAHLWFTGTTPTLTGTTTPGTSVTVSVDSQASAAIVDATGNWSLPLNLTPGDHQISLSSEGVVFSSFTLTIGEDVPAGTSDNPADSSSAALPVTGSTETTLLLAVVGILLVIGSRFLPKPTS